MLSSSSRLGTAMRAFGAVALLTVCLGVAPGPARAATLDEQAGAWAQQDAQALRRAAPRLVDSAITSAFERIDIRVSSYADWVYGWLSSLVTAWDLAYVGATEAGREIADGKVPDTVRLHARLADVVEHRFETTVVIPEQTSTEFAAAWHRAMLRLSSLDADLAADRSARIRAAAARAGVDPTPALSRFGGPLLPASVMNSLPPPDLIRRSMHDAETNAGGTTDSVLFRSLRPLATRTISVGTRLFIAPVAGGLVASPVLGASGVGAAVATLAAVSAGIWGFDYAVNRVDSALNRPAFEAGLRSVVQDAHDRASTIVRTTATTMVCGALTITQGCPPPTVVAAQSSGG